MGVLEGRVAVVTGAGNGIGREHALLFASEGAAVVVNDLGSGGDGVGSDTSAAQRVVDEILAAGGRAVANHHDVADYPSAAALIDQAVEEFGRLDVLVNNAGILRDAFLHRMTEEEWDLVVRVHLKGHFCTMRHAAEYWRGRGKAGEQVRGAVVNTTSAMGTFISQPGQANYGAAKAGIAALTLIAAGEFERIGVRVNAIAPAARTRLTEDVPGFGEMFRAPDDPEAFDTYHPRHVSPLVAYLAREDCELTGRVFAVQGGRITDLQGWQKDDIFTTDGVWNQATLEQQLGSAFTPDTPR